MACSIDMVTRRRSHCSSDLRLGDYSINTNRCCLVNNNYFSTLQSYYIFKILCFLQKDKSILVTSGLHPIGQAAISIGLAEKCQVYVIVESNQQVDQLSNIFPEVNKYT